MGAGQSSSNTHTGTGQEVKSSYYELLGVQRQATEEELKKAYRKKALELHPDRNFGNEEAATKTFAEIQAAYEVLSDPQERAWYDSHESAILRGEDAGDGNVPTYADVRVTTADDLARLVRKFNSNVTFSDSPSGFFGFLRETFEQLVQEEEIAANWENVEVAEYPTFGHKDDVYEDVVKKFYAGWSNFTTVKSFSWKDKHRLSEAPDRWYRRRMEQENNRLRQEAKREFNEAVRSLVAFVKKRDPRYVPNTQSEADRQQTLRDAAAAQAARARAANLANVSADVPEWTKTRDPEELEESEEEEIEEEVLECVACNKIFKSERQWEAHEKSKKHQKATRSLRQKMKKDDANLDLQGSGTLTPNTDEEELDVSQDLAGEANDFEPIQPVDENDISSQNQLRSEDETHDLPTDSQQTKMDTLPSEKPVASDEDDTSANSENEDYASIEAIQARMDSTSLNTPSTTLPEIDDDKVSLQPAEPKVGKAKQKRAKKAAAAISSDPVETQQHRCAGCSQEFSSKTLLFQHLREQPGHAAIKTTPSKGKKRSGKR